MNNRFKCLLDEEEPKRERTIRRKRYEERERRYVSVNNLKTNIEKQQGQNIENNEVNFPLLATDNNNLKKTNQIEVSYGSILKNEEKSKNKKTKEKKKKKGWVQLGVKSESKNEIQPKVEGLNDYLYFIDCMVNLYEHQKLEKIEILGEENYERIYKFQNYDYEYFDKLDEKYEDELEAEMKKYENESYGYNSDNST
jgi:hypothetical protein